MNELDTLRAATKNVERFIHQADANLKAVLDAKSAAKNERSPFDRIEEKLSASTALAAAASGNPEQARAELSRARSKALQAAADGADTTALYAIVREMEHLTKVAEDTRNRKKNGGSDLSAAIIPTLAAINSLKG